MGLMIIIRDDQFLTGAIIDRLRGSFGMGDDQIRNTSRTRAKMIKSQILTVDVP